MTDCADFTYFDCCLFNMESEMVRYDVLYHDITALMIYINNNSEVLY
jgi:hypothetical protein